MGATLEEQIKTLSALAWEEKASEPHLSEWLSNFDDSRIATIDLQRQHALFLLSKFMFFGDREIRELLKSLYRDLFKYSIVANIRASNGNTTDEAFLKARFKIEQENTRFLGVGNPSESGPHLLYYFRQENRLPKSLFIHSHRIISRSGTRSNPSAHLTEPSVTRYILIDDLCGSGQQIEEYAKDLVGEIRSIDPTIEIHYFVLFGRKESLEQATATVGFNSAKAVMELTSSFQAFSTDSRIFQTGSVVDSSLVKRFAEHYGQILWPSNPLGYRDGQYLLGFHHNTPDNTLPIFWYDEDGSTWNPIFRRYPKLYD